MGACVDRLELNEDLPRGLPRPPAPNPRAVRRGPQRAWKTFESRQIAAELCCLLIARLKNGFDGRFGGRSLGAIERQYFDHFPMKLFSRGDDPRVETRRAIVDHLVEL